MRTISNKPTVKLTRRQFLISGLAALTLPLVGYTEDQSDTESLTAPELDIDYWIDKDGNPTTFTLSQHEGKWVFLKCFQSWCPGCHSYGLPAVKRISDALKGNPNIVFAGIQTVFEGFNVNTVDKVRQTQLQYELEFTMGHDPGSEEIYPSTMLKYQTGGTPWMILISPDREIIHSGFSIHVDNAISYLREQTA